MQICWGGGGNLHDLLREREASEGHDLCFYGKFGHCLRSAFNKLKTRFPVISLYISVFTAARTCKKLVSLLGEFSQESAAGRKFSRLEAGALAVVMKMAVRLVE